jgi:hypothetical protein
LDCIPIFLVRNTPNPENKFHDQTRLRQAAKIFLLHRATNHELADLSYNDKLTLVQYAILKYENEATLLEKLKTVLSEKDAQRSIDTLIGTQRVRRIGPEILQNNESHTELPELPDSLRPIIDGL